MDRIMLCEKFLPKHFWSKALNTTLCVPNPRPTTNSEYHSCPQARTWYRAFIRRMDDDFVIIIATSCKDEGLDFYEDWEGHHSKPSGYKVNKMMLKKIGVHRLFPSYVEQPPKISLKPRDFKPPTLVKPPLFDALIDDDETIAQHYKKRKSSKAFCLSPPLTRRNKKNKETMVHVPASKVHVEGVEQASFEPIKTMPKPLTKGDKQKELKKAISLSKRRKEKQERLKKKEEASLVEALVIFKVSQPQTIPLSIKPKEDPLPPTLQVEAIVQEQLLTFVDASFANTFVHCEFPTIEQDPKYWGPYSIWRCLVDLTFHLEEKKKKVQCLYFMIEHKFAKILMIEPFALLTKKVEQKKKKKKIEEEEEETL
ncbi:hypothetical protein CR513_06982, partial [Mucuna pruriens]